MYNPISTYRIQFNKDFTLADLEKQLEYLELLGAGTIYASPLFKATPGSMHGYDVTNPLQLNPEVTTEKEFEKVRKKLEKNKIGWLQDIVPNHMAFHHENLWLMDVLEKGNLSDFHPVFDFEPGVPGTGNPLMVPFLGSSLEEAIANGEIKLGWKNGNFAIFYFDNVYPACFETFRDLLQESKKELPGKFSILWEDKQMPISGPGKSFLNDGWEKIKEQTRDLYNREKSFSSLVDNILQTVNASPEKLKKILDQQHYQLCHWQETEKRINYRRFFTVNGLICLRMEAPEVFELFHQTLKKHVDKNHIKGLRIDHIDGLNDPNGYLKNLRRLCGSQTYIVAEKILEHDEELPDFWPIQGSTGYDFLAVVNNLLTSVKNHRKLRELYREVTNIKTRPSELVYRNKKMILSTRMHGEWDNIVDFFNRYEFIDYKKTGVSPEDMKMAIGEFMLACPVYRLYPRRIPLRDDNRKMVESILDTALERNPDLKPALELLGSVLLTSGESSEGMNQKLERFFARLMQFTGPLMAKGVEDTSMYQYNCFIAHNEVGDAINARGITVDEYHRFMQGRQKDWPFTMNNTSTHDTKRGEDVRARLNVISVLTDEWEAHVHRWIKMNQRLKIRLETALEPSLSVEYFIYQTLLGTFPFEGEADENYIQRIDDYLVKALREAKRKVSWRDPDETYENTVCAFTRSILDPTHEFLADFVSFQQKVAWRGVVNSLVQLTLKCTSPGVPDTYQGTELWDLTLVDPDNRQPVDYEKRHDLLKKLKGQFKKDPSGLMKELNRNPFDGRIKLLLTHLLLNERKNQPELFLKGDYIPVEVKGKYKDHIISFARMYENKWFICVLPLITAGLSDKPEGEYLSEISWDDTRMLWPRGAPSQWQSILNQKTLDSKNPLFVASIFENAGLGLFKNI